MNIPSKSKILDVLGKTKTEMVRNKGWALAIAIFVTLAINTTDSLVVGAESTNAALNILSKLSYSISTVNIKDLLACVAVYCMIEYVDVRKKEGRGKAYISCSLFVGTVFSFLYIWCFSYKDTADTYNLFANSWQTFLTCFRFIGYALLFGYLFKVICVAIEDKAIKLNAVSERNNNPKIFFFCAGVIFLGWIIWIVMRYPATVAGDAIGMLNQYFKGEIDTHHPPLSIFIMGSLVGLGLKLGNGAIGLFLYVFIQAIICALIFAYMIHEMYKIGATEKVCLLTACCIAFLPVFGVYAQYFEKDMLYSIFTLLFLVKAIRVVINGHFVVKDIVILTLVGLLCSFLRNNGIYAVVPLMISLVVLFKAKKERVMILISAVVTVSVYLIVQNAIFPIAGIEKGHIREALSIPMQQSARYIKEHGLEVTEDEYEVLEGFFENYFEEPAIYDPYCADDVKRTVIVEKKDLPLYFRTWAKMGLKHPKTYFDAFMSLNYGYLALTEQNIEPTLTSEDVVIEQLGDLGVDGTQNEQSAQILQSIVFINVVFPFLRYFTMPGLFTWITIGLTAFFITIRSKKGFVLMIPNIINILVCLASPLCNGMRYQLPVVISVPIMAVLAVYECRSKSAQ